MTAPATTSTIDARCQTDIHRHIASVICAYIGGTNQPSRTICIVGAISVSFITRTAWITEADITPGCVYTTSTANCRIYDANIDVGCTTIVGSNVHTTNQISIAFSITITICLAFYTRAFCSAEVGITPENFGTATAGCLWRNARVGWIYTNIYISTAAPVRTVVLSALQAGSTFGIGVTIAFSF
jgi:hypothetical protein